MASNVATLQDTEKTPGNVATARDPSRAKSSQDPNSDPPRCTDDVATPPPSEEIWQPCSVAPPLFVNIKDEPADYEDEGAEPPWAQGDPPDPPWAQGDPPDPPVPSWPRGDSPDPVPGCSRDSGTKPEPVSTEPVSTVICEPDFIQHVTYYDTNPGSSVKKSGPHPQVFRQDSFPAPKIILPKSSTPKPTSPVKRKNSSKPPPGAAKSKSSLSKLYERLTVPGSLKSNCYLPKPGNVLPEGALFSCDQCKYSTPHSANLTRHKLAHSGVRPFSCPTCGKSFPFQVSLEYHMLSAHKQAPPVFCSQCEFRCSGKSELTAHMLVHGQDLKCACPYCGNKFINSSSLGLHVRKFHTDEYVASKSEAAGPTVPGMRFNCQYCPRSFKNESSLPTHMRICHKDISPGGFPCPSCAEVFNESRALDNHLKHHCGRPYSCAKCSTKFPSLQQVADHMAQVHAIVKELTPIQGGQYLGYSWSLIPGGGSASFRCDRCSECFSIEREIKGHIRAVHNAVRTYPCELCGYVASHKHVLTEHMLVHRGARPYECKFCSKKFSRKSCRRIHERNIHIRDRLFRCQLCDYSSRWHNNVQVHMRRHTGEKAFQCGTCHRRFSAASALKTHHIRVHKARLLSCAQCKYTSVGKDQIKSHMRRVHLRGSLI